MKVLNCASDVGSINRDFIYPTNLYKMMLYQLLLFRGELFQTVSNYQCDNFSSTEKLSSSLLRYTVLVLIDTPTQTLRLPSLPTGCRSVAIVLIAKFGNYNVFTESFRPTASTSFLTLTEHVVLKHLPTSICPPDKSFQFVHKSN